MKILCIGDLHIQKRNTLIFNQFQIKLLDYLRRKENTVDLIVVLGDVLHTMNIINTQCMNVAINFFKELDEIGIKIIVLIGNHDFIGPNEYLSTNHWMNALSAFNPKNITVVDKVHTIPISGNKKGNLVFIPYVSPGRFNETVEGHLDNCKYIFCHQEFKGVVYEFGNVVSENGDVFEDNRIQVISGHIHKKQWLGKNIYYVGTPYQTRFNEDANKTVALIDTSTQNIDEIYLDLPQMITLYTHLNDVESIEASTFVPNNLYKIVIKVDLLLHIQSFLKTKAYKMLKKYAIIIFDYPKVVDTDTSVESDKPPNFKEILYTKVQHNPNMLYLFDKILKDD